MVLGLTTLVLLGGVGLLMARGQFKQEPKFHGRLEDLLPKPGEVPDWDVSYAPIADTPEIKAKIDELLNYDQGVFAIYRRGDFRVSVYLAYWRPGKMPVRAIAGHTPDVCWIKSGWECVERNEYVHLIVGGRSTGHTEHGIYAINGQAEHVAFWHVAGGEIISYHTKSRPPWYAAITEFLHWGRAIKQEQFFLRISSNHPVEIFIKSEIVQEVISQVPGIMAPSR